MTAQCQSHSQRWRQVVSRDPDARFIYAVSSTKIYCRPSCPARLARRAGVQFFDSAAEAESAGFRACKRCRPSEETAQETPAQVLARVCARIESGVRNNEKLRLVDLARDAGLSPCYLLRRFKACTGLTPRAYAGAFASRLIKSGVGDARDGFSEGESPALTFGESDDLNEDLSESRLEDRPVEPFDFADWVDWESELIMPSQLYMDLEVSC